MKLVFLKFFIFFFLTSCSNINFILESKDKKNLLKNNTVVYVEGWQNQKLKNIVFLTFGEPIKKRFLLEVKARETQTKRSIDENQVALKIDYAISIDYTLKDLKGSCPDIFDNRVSKFSFTPKSSGYNFASDVLFENLLKKAVFENVDGFMDFAHSALKSQNCIDEN